MQRLSVAVQHGNAAVITPHAQREWGKVIGCEEGCALKKILEFLHDKSISIAYRGKIQKVSLLQICYSNHF